MRVRKRRNSGRWQSKDSGFDEEVDSQDFDLDLDE